MEVSRSKEAADLRKGIVWCKAKRGEAKVKV